MTGLATEDLARSAKFTQDGADTRIQIDADDAVTLVEVNLADLNEDNFING